MTALALDPLTLAYHELRSPLGLVATAARSLVEESADESLRRRCEVILRSVERMLRTTGSVLALARGEGEESPDWFTPAEVVTQLAADLGSFDVRLDLQVTTDAGACRHFGARGIFETLVQSLLSNAIDHSDPGAVVVIRLGREDGALTLTISNPVAAKKRHTGLGAGLYLCSKLADQLGGALQAEAEDGLFHARIRLPLSGA